MDEPTFDRLTRVLGRTQTRREALRALAATGFAAFVAACTGQIAPSPTPSPSPSPSAKPRDECPTASTCNAKNFCNEDQTCMCIASAEGVLRCGQIPDRCDVPLCQTSADCAYLGEGWFCDTPNSGCCTDPPASLPRCIGPCGAAPAPTATPSPYATMAANWGTNAENFRDQVGKRFDFICPPNGTAGTVYGTDEYTSDSSICTAAVHAGLITLAQGGYVQIQIGDGADSFPGSTRNGITTTPWMSPWGWSYTFPDAKPQPTAAPTPVATMGTVTCPTNGTCQECRLAESNDAVNCADCTTAGVAATLCGTANTDVAFGALAGRLLADGYRQAPPTGPESAQFYGGEGLERSVYISYFTHSANAGQTAQLAYRETAFGEKNAFAVLLVDGSPTAGLFANADGALEEQPVQAQPTVAITAAGMLGLSVSDPLTAFLFGCSYNCNILCGAVFATGAALAAAALCGPGFTVCAVLLWGALAGGVGGAACNGICNSVCEETPQRVFCGCNKGCYSSAGECTVHCHSGLGCFAQNLCGPDPICNTPLREFGS